MSSDREGREVVQPKCTDKAVVKKTERRRPSWSGIDEQTAKKRAKDRKRAGALL
jgi:hypothetical protein